MPQGQAYGVKIQKTNIFSSFTQKKIRFRKSQRSRRIPKKLSSNSMLIHGYNFRVSKKFMQTDQKLVFSIVQGDRAAFRKLYEAFRVQVYNTALSYVQNSEDAEEITQDVFVEIHQSIRHFKGVSKLSTWIYRITINKSLDLTRRKKSRKRFVWLYPLQNQEANVQPDTTPFRHPGVALENQENAQILFQTIDLLPENQKTAFILSYVEDLPRQEIAEIMNLSLKAIESLLQRAKNNLRKLLDKWYPERRKSK